MSATKHAGKRRKQKSINVEKIVLALSILLMIGFLLAIGLQGFSYYKLSLSDQLYSEDHDLLGTTGVIGILCGATAAGLFLSNFGYLLRKQLRILDSLGTLRLWLDWHVVSAFLGSGFVALHANFNFSIRNWIARTCVYSIAIMLITGLIGRYLLRFVPRSASGTRLDENSFEDEVMVFIDDVRGDVLHDPDAVLAMQSLVDEIEDEDSLPGLKELRRRLRESRRLIERIERAVRTGPHPRKGAELRSLRHRLAQLGKQAAVIHWAGQMMDSWRALHRVCALLLLVGMFVHIGISLFYGYGAVWQ